MILFDPTSSSVKSYQLVEVVSGGRAPGKSSSLASPQLLVIGRFHCFGAVRLEKVQFLYCVDLYNLYYISLFFQRGKRWLLLSACLLLACCSLLLPPAAAAVAAAVAAVAAASCCLLLLLLPPAASAAAASFCCCCCLLLLLLPPAAAASACCCCCCFLLLLLPPAAAAASCCCCFLLLLLLPPPPPAAAAFSCCCCRWCKHFAEKENYSLGRLVWRWREIRAGDASRERECLQKAELMKHSSGSGCWQRCATGFSAFNVVDMMMLPIAITWKSMFVRKQS